MISRQSSIRFSNSATTACRLSVGSSFVCFVVVGGVATALHYAVMVGFVEWVGALPVVASALGFVVGAVVGYLLNRRFTFASARDHREALPRYVVVAAVGLIINVVALTVLLEVFDWFYLWAQVVATVVALFWNFGANRLWTFDPVRGANPL